MIEQLYYHYCSVETMKSIIENKEFWISDAYRCNDYTEFKYIDGLLQEILEGYKSQQDTNSNTKKDILKEICEVKAYFQKKNIIAPFLICFSKNGDKLSQWRGYAKDASGVSVGVNLENIEFDIGDGVRHTVSKIDIKDWVDKFDKVKSNNYDESEVDNMRFYMDANFRLHIAYWLEVIYEKEEQIDILKKIFEYFLYILSKYSENKEKVNLYKNILFKLIVLCGCAFKNSSFKEEDEVRIVYFAVWEDDDSYENLHFSIKDGNDLIAYFKLGKLDNSVFKAIILGPKCKLKTNVHWEKFLRKNDVNPKIVESSIPYC